MQHVRWEEVPSETIGENVRRWIVWGDKGTLARFSFAANTHVSPHKHESEQHTCLIEGQLKIKTEDQEIILNAGEILVIPSWVEHEVWALEKSVVVDFFSPPRADWKEGRSDRYLEGK